MSANFNNKANKYYAGIDLHKNYSYMTIVNHQGYIQHQGRYNNIDHSLIPMLLQYNNKGVDKQIEATVESTYGWYWLADKLDEASIPFRLAHPKKVNAIAGKKKTDSVDSKILADLLRMNMLPESYIPTKQERSLKELLRFRLMLARERATIKRRLRDILAKQNIHCSFTDILGKKAQSWLLKLNCPYPYGKEIKSLLTLSKSVTKELEAFAKQVANQARKDSKTQLLKSIPGIGPVLGLTLSIEIGNVYRFANDRALSSYAGLVPSVRSSGDKTWYGRTSKHGNKYIRWALAEAAPHLIRKDPIITAFYKRIKKKKGKSKAKVAVMNKMTRIIYAMLIKQRPYRIQTNRVKIDNNNTDNVVH